MEHGEQLSYPRSDYDRLEFEDVDRDDDTNTNLINPANSTRHIYFDQVAGVEREIWRPGDGDGDQATDYFNRIGLPLPLQQRWRFFQTDIGTIDSRNLPPRFVFLDDCAASAVLRSDIQKSKRVENWPHDFGGNGKIRSRRPHRGRPAIINAEADGNAKYHVTTVGTKQEPYVFIGEMGYTPVLYHYDLPKPEVEKSSKRKFEHPDDYNPRAHGHNQYTPRDLLVKNGAPSFSKRMQQSRLPRIDAFLRRHATPHSTRDCTLTNGIAKSPRIYMQHDTDKHEKEAAVASEEGQPRRSTRHEADETEELRVLNEIQPSPDVVELFIPYGRQGSSFPLHRLNGFASIPDKSPLIEVPANMSFVQQRAFEQNLAAQFLSDTKTKDDVMRMALDLARARIKVSEQAQEIERWEQELAEQMGSS